MTSQPLFEARNLSKSYGPAESVVRALADVSLSIGDGEFLAITGPSGSGKTTLLGLLGLLARPSEGRLFFRGEDTAAFSDVRAAGLRNSEIGFVFQAFQLFSGRADHYPAELSGGEQQRVAIARAIINSPKVILADEPTGALDSRTGAEIMDILKMLNLAGTSVVVITHNADVAAEAHRQVELVDGCLSGTTNRSTPPGTSPR